MITKPEPQILANVIRTPDGTVLQSYHRHDYKVHQDLNGYTYMVDGGVDYLRRNLVTEAPYEELSVWEDDPHETIRRWMAWGTRGLNGDQPVRWIHLWEMETDHIQACLDNVQQMMPSYRKAMTRELNWRRVHG